MHHDAQVKYDNLIRVVAPGGARRFFIVVHGYMYIIIKIKESEL